MELLTKPVVGAGITYAINGDSYPYTITEVSKSGHQFRATRDGFVADPKIDQGYSEADKKGLFVPSAKGESELFTRKQNGRYQLKGAPYVHVYEGRSYRQDPSF